ncbi:MAG: tetratricopeptide repeat protein, partial [Desulfobulbaceae bacterium]|nr:tetratricopeptide repeat protein [Desulfobulbaceae bacterium]
AAPDAPEVQLAMARFQARQQNFAEAESLLKKIVAAHPEALAAKRELGDFYQSREQRDQAAALYNDMIRQAPTEPSGYLRLAGLRARAKQGEEAVAVLRGGLARNPDAPVLMEGLVQLLMAGGRHQEALRVVREILTRHPKDAFVYTLLGNVHGAVKDFPAAEAAYQQAMALDPSRFEPVANLARLYVVQGKEKQAIADLGKQVTAASTPARFLLLATLHEQSRQPQQAVAVYRQGLAKYPRSWVFANNLAFLLAEQQGGDLAKAYDLARQAQLLAPGNGTVLDTLGWIAFKRGRNEEARAVLSLAAAGNGQPTVNYHLAMVLLQLGDKKQARERLQAAVDAPADFPERPAAKRALAGLAS